MENFETTNSNELKVSDTIRENITAGMKWANFLTIIMCIGVGFMFLGGAMIILGSVVAPAGMPGTMGFMGIFYILMAAGYIYPIKLSFAGMRNVRDAFDKESQEDLEDAANNLRKLLKFVGILMIIIIVFSIILVPVTIAASAFSAAGM